jgi:hypothetical protein
VSNFDTFSLAAERDHDTPSVSASQLPSSGFGKIIVDTPGSEITLLQRLQIAIYRSCRTRYTPPELRPFISVCFTVSGTEELSDLASGRNTVRKYITNKQLVVMAAQSLFIRKSSSIRRREAPAMQQASLVNYFDYFPAAGQSLIAWEANNGYSPPDSNSIQSMCTINTNMRNVRFGLKYIF